MVETDPRPPPYNAELLREFCLEYWIGSAILKVRNSAEFLVGILVRSAPYKEQLQLKLLLAYW